MTTVENLTQETIDHYRREGFVRVSGILSPEEAAEFHEAALATAQRMKSLCGESPIFSQFVNVWRQDETMRRLTLHPNVAAVATRLAGTALRLWHDQILIKQPHNKAATEFHQDQPYWPHATSPNPISAWIALCDVPAEKGCMSFISRSHLRTELPAQHLADRESLYTICPDMRWEPRVTLPLKAGDCTFHHGRCAHMATPNLTDDPRVGHVIIFMERTTTYSGAPHVVTDPLGLTVGERIEGELFPDR